MQKEGGRRHGLPFPACTSLVPGLHAWSAVSPPCGPDPERHPCVFVCCVGLSGTHLEQAQHLCELRFVWPEDRSAGSAIAGPVVRGEMLMHRGQRPFADSQNPVGQLLVEGGYARESQPIGDA